MRLTTVRICGIPCEVPQSWADWVRHVANCRRADRLPDGSILYAGRHHPAGCPCTDCAAWRESDRLHDKYRQDAGLPT